MHLTIQAKKSPKCSTFSFLYFLWEIKEHILGQESVIRMYLHNRKKMRMVQIHRLLHETVM